nr:hypothetical protein [Mycobacterium sp. UM_NZ2]
MGCTPVIVAGIDPSLTNCGIAILAAGQPVYLDAIGHPGRDGASYDNRSDRIVSQARAIIATAITTQPLRPDLAVIEGPAYGQNLPSNHDRAGLWWGLYSALRAKRIPTAVVAPGTRAKWATGSGRATKTDVLATVRTWWPNTTIRNHDIADAAVLAALGAYHLGDPMPFTPKPRHQLGADVIDWPEVTTT